MCKLYKMFIYILSYLQAFHKNKMGEWSKAKNFGNAALYLSIAAWIYTLVISLFILAPFMVLLYRCSIGRCGVSDTIDYIDYYRNVTDYYYNGTIT